MANAFTTTYNLTKPEVGASEDTWGGHLNVNLDTLDDLLDGTTGITPNLLSGWEVGGTAVTATAAEFNVLDGITATVAELNILDGVTATAAELNILDGVTATTAELNILDGVTATAAEINFATDLADGVTATTAELNILDGVTATTAELNILDGVTATTAELNYMDGVTSNVQTQINAIPAGGAYSHIESQTASSDATLDFTGFDAAVYDDYFFVFRNVKPVNSSVSMDLERSINGGASYSTSFDALVLPSTISSTFRIASNIGNTSTFDGFSGDMTVYGAGQLARTKLQSTTMGQSNTGGIATVASVGFIDNRSALDAFRFKFSSGNIASGEISMYGLKKP